MDAVTALEKLGGVARTREIEQLSSRRKLRGAVDRGEIEHVGRGAYALSTVEAGRAAARLSGVKSHLSAAAHWGWATKTPGGRPHVAVPRGRNVAKSRRVGVHVHWLRLADHEVDGPATSKLRTVLDCARDLPFDQALAVADSALRSGDLSHDELHSAAASCTGPSAAKVRRVAAYADGRAANPFESVLRALAIEAGLDVVPQFPIEVHGVDLHPDLVDPGRGLVLEADSFSWHGDREAFEADCLRYNGFCVAGYVVLRFTYEHVMREPDYVLRTLRTWVDGPLRRAA